MKGRLILILFLLVSVLAWSNLEAQSGAAKGKGRVRGKVADAQGGNGIPNATVRFASSELQTSFEIKTDEKGEWIVNGIAGGTWDLDFQKEGYETKRISVGIQTLGYNKPIEIALQKASGKAPSTAVTGKPSESGPADPSKALIQQGAVLADEGKHAEAIAKYEEAIKLNPGMYLLYGDIGNLYRRMNQHDKAVEAYKKILEKDPTNQSARLSVAIALLEKKDIEAAKKLLEGLDLNTVTNPNTVYEIGVRFYNAQETKEAIRYWEKAIEKDPKMVDAYVQLGAAYVSVGQNDKAKQMLQKAIELAPGTDNAKIAQEMLDSMQ